MKNLVLALFILAFPFLFVSCESSDSDSEDTLGNWFGISDFEGVGRKDAAAFVIDGKAYVGTGFDGDDRLKDLWQYDPEKNWWKQMAELPGDERNGAVAFAANGKGYIGTGYNGNEKLQDFYAFDPGTNTWSRIANFPASGRYGAIGFGINNKGYVGTGYDGNYLKDMWQYDPTSDSWTQKVSIGGSKRRYASVFVIDEKAYVATGENNGSYEEDFWEYNASTDTWKELREINDKSDEDYDDDYEITRTKASAFSLNGKGYIACGEKGSILNSIWEYDPETDLWVKKNAFEASARSGAVGFAIGQYGYVGIGASSSYYFDDIFAFEPEKEKDEDD